MSVLNSIVLEGTVSSVPVEWKTSNGISVYEFTVQTLYKYLQDGEVKEEKNIFGVEVYTECMRTCIRRCKEGRGIRIVGRLKSEDGSVKIVAEHMELRPYTQDNGWRKQGVD